MKVQAESELVRAIAAATGQSIEGYICIGGDHAGQRNKAMLRPFVKATNAIRPTRLTKSGHAMLWVAGKDGRGTREYVLTSREVRRRKSKRSIQAASRKANRSK